MTGGDLDRVETRPKVSSPSLFLMVARLHAVNCTCD